ncbi:hypothetical protein [Phaeobacter sp. HF9A]|uniref:hypothetical protein n=1 Tax=Phaeobacter sp. HF9A TaxID=2721561 RepID=UPI001430A332|nr:hypothetical protein [Phaeobacter sp. HF9A]NIZ15213.1 hypothetical protein [Phaeobacter sp. HF9A]
MTRFATSPRSTHRKFIAFVLAAAVAVTGMSAAPARADNGDVAKFIAGAALLGIIGAAINDSRHRDDHADHHGHGGHQPVPPRPLPPRVRKYDLPVQCIKTVRAWGRDHQIAGMRCLKQNYRHVNSLPQNCYVKVENRHQKRHGYGVQCLANKGYRFTRQTAWR